MLRLVSNSELRGSRARTLVPSRQHFHPKSPHVGLLRRVPPRPRCYPARFCGRAQGGFGKPVVTQHPILIITQSELRFRRLGLEFLRILQSSPGCIATRCGSVGVAEIKIGVGTRKPRPGERKIPDRAAPPAHKNRSLSWSLRCPSNCRVLQKPGRADRHHRLPDRCWFKRQSFSSVPVSLAFRAEATFCAT